MRNLVFFLCLICLSGSVIAAPIPKDAGKPALRPLAPKFVDRFHGRVEAIDKVCILLKPEGRLRYTSDRFNEDGVLETFLHEQDNNQPDKLFMFSDKLLTINGVDLPRNRVWLGDGGRGRTEHNPIDVRLGDRVSISFGTKNGVLYCTSLTILRRPGGRVPDTVEDDDPCYKVKVSTERNAQQFVEETFAAKWAPKLVGVIRK